MRKLSVFLFLLLCTCVNAQYQVNGFASVSTSNPNEFQLVPPDNSHIAGSVFNTSTISLNQNFVLNVQLYFGVNDLDGGDGLAFILQGEGPSYLGNVGAGLGYHRFDGKPDGMPVDNPGPVPSFIVEFDTYQNDYIFTQNIGDPAEDHLGFMSRSNAYHTNPTALSPPYPFAVNIEDGAWHDASFAWNASSKTFTVQFLNQTYSYQGNMDSVVGNTPVYWGFTAGYGHAPNEHRVRVLNMTIGQPLSVSGVVTNASCTPGSIDITPFGGVKPYTYSWSNGANTEDLASVPAGNYLVTVSDAIGASVRQNFTVLNVPDKTPPVLTCPGTQTLCYNLLLGYYTIPQLTATDNCGVGTINYKITGATSRTGSGKNASGLFNPGVSTITWTVKDINGNSSSCTTQVNINKVSVDIPDVYAVNPGGNANTIYLGYGPSSLTLTANATGGTGPYTYLWSTGATTKSINVSPMFPGIYTYIILVRDAMGCSSLGLQLVRVVDVRCGKGDKVSVCHIPPGNPRNANEICIAKSAVPDHLAHGDKLGSCGDRDDRYRRTPDASITEAGISGSEGVYPNPTRGRFELHLNNQLKGSVQVVIMNTSGAVIERRNVQVSSADQVLKFDLTGKGSGIYLVKLIGKDGSQSEKIVLQ
ncbi:MAG: lectin-like domain-containing protein [Flavisolibacter sp.]